MKTTRRPTAARTRRRATETPATSGNWNRDWEAFATLDPAWADKVVAMSMVPFVTGALDARTLELICLALDASCTSLYTPGVRNHIRRALKAGATREQITAVLQLASRQGLHSVCVAAPILLEELERAQRLEETVSPSPSTTKESR